VKSPWAIPNDPRIVGHRPPEDCPDCGYDELNCRCDDVDFMDELDCTHCGGDGVNQTLREILHNTDRIVEGCVVAMSIYSNAELEVIAAAAEKRGNGKSWLADMIREYVAVWRGL
jgi:hypothetical protein